MDNDNNIRYHLDVGGTHSGASYVFICGVEPSGERSRCIETVVECVEKGCCDHLLMCEACVTHPSYPLYLLKHTELEDV